MTEEKINGLIALGYRRTSRKYGCVSRIDRVDWKSILRKRGIKVLKGDDFCAEDFYRRCSSKDTLTVSKQDVLKFPTSRGSITNYVGPLPKDEE